MKKLYLLLLLFLGYVPAGWTQRPGTANLVPTGEAPTTPPSRWQEHADSIFQHLNRSLVGTGLLTNYGFALKDYNQFQGTALSPANLLQNLGEWRLLYGALQTSVFNSNATLPTLNTANLRIQQADQQAPDVVPIATLLARSTGSATTPAPRAWSRSATGSSTMRPTGPIRPTSSARW